MNPLNVLSKSGFGVPVMQHITDCYAEPHRSYHDIGHIKEMLAYVEPFKSGMDEITYEALQLAIVWHDVIYSPTSKTNEEDSFWDFMECYSNLEDKYKDLPKRNIIIPCIKLMIMDTKSHDYDQAMPVYRRLIIEADLDRFKGPFPAFWQNTLRIFKEYAMADWGLFKPGRIAFLESYAEKVKEVVGQEGYDNCMASALVLSVWEPKIAIYAGSFNDFHIGHQRIVDKACKIFDKVIIVRCQNPDKPANENKLPKILYDCYQVEEHIGWITNYIKSKNYNVTLIRGLRNGSDLNGEINYERFLKDLMPEIQVVSIFTDADVEHVSSSGVKGLIRSAMDGDVIPPYLIK